MSSPNFDAFSILFGDEPALLADLREHCIVRRYEKGATILHHQDESTDVHYMLNGHAKAYLLSADGKEVWMNEFGVGTMFGEIAALSGSPRVCSIAAFTAVETAMFRGPVFMDLMRSHGAFGIAVSKLLANRLNMTSQRMYMASVGSLEGRVIVELLDRSVPADDDAVFTHVIRPVPVIADVARKVGSARESVSRVITALCRDEYIVRTNSEWRLKDPDSLLALAL